MIVMIRYMIFFYKGLLYSLWVNMISNVNGLVHGNFERA